MANITSNKIQCCKCLTVIESTHRHDFKRCSCGAVAVDGGHDYLRRAGGPYFDLAEFDGVPADHGAGGEGDGDG